MNPKDNAKSIYWSAGPDRRKIALLIYHKIWIVAAGVIFGAVSGALIYLLYHAVTDKTEYSAYSEFYLDFAYDPTGEVYDYYNGYTWNDLVMTDPIAGHTLEELEGTGVDIGVLEAATNAEILSDIRVLKVTVREHDEALCAEIRAATEKALVLFGREAREFEQITVIKSAPVKRLYADDRLMQAVILGIIIGFLTGVFAVWFVYILDDKVRFPADLTDCGAPVIRVGFVREDEALSSRFQIRRIGEKKPGDQMPDGDPSSSDRGSVSEQASHMDAGSFADLDSKWIGLADGSGIVPAENAVRGETKDLPVAADNVIIDIPYAKVNRTAVILLAEKLRSEGHEVVGFTIDKADNREYKRYYFDLFPKR